MLEDVDVFASHLRRCTERVAGACSCAIIDLAHGRRRTTIAFAEPAYTRPPSANAEFETTTFRFVYQSLTTPRVDLRLRPRDARARAAQATSRCSAATTRALRSRAHLRDGRRRRRRCRSRSSTRRDAQRDGPQPLLLYGYGSYGIPIDPVVLVDARLSLLDRGVVFAIAHIRGGGELGKHWHDDGRMMKKRNTFTDFIACAEHLVARASTRAATAW